MQVQSVSFPYRGPRESRKVVQVQKALASDASRLYVDLAKVWNDLNTVDNVISNELISMIEHAWMQVKFWGGG
jgi:hypothetical protein